MGARTAIAWLTIGVIVIAIATTFDVIVGRVYMYR